jgi:hypothetical protein
VVEKQDLPQQDLPSKIDGLLDLDSVGGHGAVESSMKSLTPSMPK